MSRRDVLESAKRGVIIGLSSIATYGKRDENGLTGYHRARWDELIAIEREIDRTLAQQEPDSPAAPMPEEPRVYKTVTGRLCYLDEDYQALRAHAAALQSRLDKSEQECAELRASQKFLHGERMEWMKRSESAESALAAVTRERDEARRELNDAVPVIEFYASHETWWAVSLFADPPCGEIMQDFDVDESDPHQAQRPGKRARDLFRKYAARSPDGKE